MFKRNPGRFTHKITLLKPTAPERDELGGVKSGGFTEVVTLFAMCEQKDQSRQVFVGDYVTADTRYFVLRDIRGYYPIDVSWRLTYRGYTWIINDVRLLDESRPYYLQITATAVNGGGEAL